VQKPVTHKAHKVEQLMFKKIKDVRNAIYGGKILVF
jgi:hypothetical protein